MNSSPDTFPWPDPNFASNREKFPFEELLRYVGHHVAWSWDGSRLLAADKDENELYRKLAEAGHDWQHVVIDYVGDPDVSYL